MTDTYFVAFLASPSLAATKAMIHGRLHSLGMSVSSKSPAHLTVKTPIELSSRQVNALEDKIAGLVSTKALQPFTAPLGTVATFENDAEGIVYLPVLGDAQTIIRYLLKEFDFPTAEFDGTTPHITLASVPRSQLPLALGDIQTIQFPKSQKFDHLAIFRKTPSGAVEVARFFF